MDPLSLATFILAIATIALAYFTFQIVRHGRYQTDMLIRQTMILRSQIDPIPIITAISFDKNSLNLTVENLGSGPASSLAIETVFTPAKRVFFENADSQKPLSESEIKESLLDNEKITIRYEVEEKTLVQNGVKFKPTRLAYPLSNKRRNTLVLLPHETCTYNVDLGFGFDDVKNSSGLFPLYEELVKVLKLNDVSCFILGFRLLCKNMAEESVPDQSIACFIVDLTRHSNIEQAYNENTTPPMTIGLLDLALKGIPINSQMYVDSKSETYSPKIS